MAKYLSNIDLQKNELQNAKIQALATDPASPVAGQVYFNTAVGRLKIYDGAAWRFASGLFTNADIASDAAIALSKLATDPLARANHTGTQTASTISDFDTQVRTSRLDQMAAPTASVSLNSQKITSLSDPTDPQDAATKNYVDSTAQGLDIKGSVRLATAAALTDYTYANGSSGVGATITANSNGALTVDGVAVASGDRILVKNQTSTEAPHNGIYTVTATGDAGTAYVLTRALDMNQAGEFAGAFTFVEAGTANADNGYVCATNNPVTVGTTAIDFQQFSGAGQITAGNGLTKNGNTIDAVGTADRITVNADSIDIASTYAGQTSITTVGTIGTGTWQGNDVGVAYGGTGASDAAGAKTNLGFMTRYAANIGNGVDAAITVTHNLGTRDVTVQVREASGSYEYVNVDVAATTENTVTLTFAVAPASNAYRVIVIG